MSFRVALIGCGRVGVLFEDDPLRKKPASHLGGLFRIPDKVKIAGCCDISQEQLEYCRDRWKITNLYSDYRTLIRKEKPDIVIIASWTSTHCEIATYAAQNGISGIVLEKPLAGNLSDARRIVAACRRHHVKLVINHERRWDPLYRMARQIIKGNQLGELRAIYGNALSSYFPRGNWQEDLEKYGGGALLHDGTHLIDMIRFLAGEIVQVSGFAFREDPGAATETTACGFLTTREGVRVFIETGGMREYFNFELDLQFSRGRLRIGNSLKEYYSSISSPRYSGFRELSKTAFPQYDEDCEPFSGAVLEVIDSIEKNREPESSGADGLKALEIIWAIYHSASNQGRALKKFTFPRGHPLKKLFIHN